VDGKFEGTEMSEYDNVIAELRRDHGLLGFSEMVQLAARALGISEEQARLLLEHDIASGELKTVTKQ
jgi:hypothetical protein